MRKESKKHPHSNKSKKDPGIPKHLPFKDSVIAELQQRKTLSENEAQRQKLLSKAAAAAKSATKKSMSIDELSRNATERAEDYDARAEDENMETDSTIAEGVVSGTKDNSKKAFYREFKKVVEIADVILEVLDARDPLGCRSKQIEEMIMASGVNKRLILVLNKVDLVPKEVAEKWLKYLRNEFPTIAFKSSTQSQRTNLSQRKGGLKNEALLATSECLGADNLMKLLKNYCRNANIKTSISVGVIGFPNVGKSSVINSLKRTKVCNVGSTPGLTKAIQEIQDWTKEKTK